MVEWLEGKLNEEQLEVSWSVHPGRKETSLQSKTSL